MALLRRRPSPLPGLGPVCGPAPLLAPRPATHPTASRAPSTRVPAGSSQKTTESGSNSRVGLAPRCPSSRFIKGTPRPAAAPFWPRAQCPSPRAPAPPPISSPKLASLPIGSWTPGALLDAVPRALPTAVRSCPSPALSVGLQPPPSPLVSSPSHPLAPWPAPLPRRALQCPEQRTPAKRRRTRADSAAFGGHHRRAPSLSIPTVRSLSNDPKPPETDQPGQTADVDPPVEFEEQPPKASEQQQGINFEEVRCSNSMQDNIIWSKREFTQKGKRIRS
ncbi:hypothetical protein U9M48_019764 [Paspalum notatum var. saurae]|uniref:Uncharacterized protein n=1 Tax=Paspalum notatum var. saurae TaxID=547442 RepID=A0AAQ3TBZ4_PASNO